MAVNMGFVEFAEHVVREVLDPETEHAEAGLPHGRQPLGRHGVDTVGTDELQLARQCASVFGGNDRLTQRQNAPVLREYEDIILEDDGAHARVRTHDTLQHLYTFFCIEPRNAEECVQMLQRDRKSTRLNSSHMSISYAVFCLKKKKLVTNIVNNNTHPMQ